MGPHTGQCGSCLLATGQRTVNMVLNFHVDIEFHATSHVPNVYVQNTHN